MKKLILAGVITCFTLSASAQTVAPLAKADASVTCADGTRSVATAIGPTSSVVAKCDKTGKLVSSTKRAVKHTSSRPIADSNTEAFKALAAENARLKALQPQEVTESTQRVAVASVTTERVVSVGKVYHKEIVVPALCIQQLAGGQFSNGQPTAWVIRNSKEECDAWDLEQRSRHSLPNK